MTEYDRSELSRREFQIMEVIYQFGPATAAEIRGRLPDAPSNSSVRKLLEILEAKGHVYHETDGPRYVYHPRVSRERASRSALGQVVETFFGGSRRRAAAALLGLDDDAVPEQVLDRIEQWAEEHRATDDDE